MTLDKGASFAIGWNQKIALEDPNLWIYRFFYECSSGLSILDALIETENWLMALPPEYAVSSTIFNIYIGDSDMFSVVLG